MRTIPTVLIAALFWMYHSQSHDTAVAAIVEKARSICLTAESTRENMEKKWFRLIFSGKEWTPVIKSMELLKEIKEYRKNPDVDYSQH